VPHAATTTTSAAVATTVTAFRVLVCHARRGRGLTRVLVLGLDGARYRDKMSRGWPQSPATASNLGIGFMPAIDTPR
jgi:hypothetical protein